jgi:hypothetical protein
MPFKNLAQQKACWAQYNRDTKAGITPKWDCHKVAHEMKYNGRTYKIRQGSRGGKYILINKTKKYIGKLL